MCVCTYGYVCTCVCIHVCVCVSLTSLVNEILYFLHTPDHPFLMHTGRWDYFVITMYEWQCCKIYFHNPQLSIQVLIIAGMIFIQIALLRYNSHSAHPFSVPMQGLPWRSGVQDSSLPLWGTQFWSPLREVRCHMLHGRAAENKVRKSACLMGSLRTWTNTFFNQLT